MKLIVTENLNQIYALPGLKSKTNLPPPPTRNQVIGPNENQAHENQDHS